MYFFLAAGNVKASGDRSAGMHNDVDPPGSTNTLTLVVIHRATDSIKATLF